MFMMRSVRKKSRARRACTASMGTTTPTAAALICKRAMRSMKTAKKHASWTLRPAVSKPWWANKSAWAWPKLALISSPSRSAVGRPGHSGKNTMSSNKGVASMWATTKGTLAAAKAEAAGGWVWTMAFTSGRLR